MKLIRFCVPALVLLASLFACSQENKPSTSANPEPPAKAIAVANKMAAPEATLPEALLGTRNAEEMVAAGYKRYGIEKGSFIFRIDGAVNGTEHVYFDHWGWREAKYTRTTTEVENLYEETNEVQFLDGERRYQYFPETKKAHYFDSGQIEDMARRYNTKDMVAVGNEMLKNMGMQPAGKAKVGQTECDVWVKAQPKIRLYMWHGLTMGEESYVNNIPIGRRCVLVDLEKDIPLEKLLLPKDVVLENINK